jgi:hypothetical protein
MNRGFQFHLDGPQGEAMLLARKDRGLLLFLPQVD